MTLNCSKEGLEEPDIHWMKDGAMVRTGSQVYIAISEQYWICFLRCWTRGRCGLPAWGKVGFSLSV